MAAPSPLEPALRVLATLRGVLKVSAGLDLGFHSAGSPILRRARMRAKAMFPAGDGRWCARVMRDRREACVRAWTRVVDRTRRGGEPVTCGCPAGLVQYRMPVRRRGRLVGMLPRLPAPPPGEKRKRVV